jgi:hypothetical protein
MMLLTVSFPTSKELGLNGYGIQLERTRRFYGVEKRHSHLSRCPQLRSAQLLSTSGIPVQPSKPCTCASLFILFHRIGRPSSRCVEIHSSDRRNRKGSPLLYSIRSTQLLFPAILLSVIPEKHFHFLFSALVNQHRNLRCVRTYPGMSE